MPLLPAFLLFAAVSPGLEALKPLAAEFHRLESAAESAKRSPDAALLASATKLEHGVRDWVALELPAADISALWAARILTAGPGGKRDAVAIGRPEGFPQAILVRVDLQLPGGAVDNAAWLYELRDRKWTRTLNLERDQQKAPTVLSGLAFSTADKSGTHLAIAVRTPSGVGGCWHPVSFQLYRVGTPTPPPLLMDDWHPANLCAHGPVVKAEPNGFSIELQDRDLRPGAVRTHILRYRLTAEHPERVQPVALKPAEFVDEWLASGWNEAIDWTLPAARAALERVHRDLQGPGPPAGEYRSVVRCSGRGRWQITLNLEKHGQQVFIVQVLGAGRFQLVSAGGSGCSAR